MIDEKSAELGRPNVFMNELSPISRLPAVDTDNLDQDQFDNSYHQVNVSDFLLNPN